MTDQQADSLGMVHGRAAAECDQAVGAACLVGGCRFLGLLLGRVRHGLREHACRCNAQRIFDLRQNAGGLDAGVRHNERPGHAELLRRTGELLQGT